MRCLECKRGKTIVVDSREFTDAGESCIRRIRKCVDCGVRFTTYESEYHPLEASRKNRVIKNNLNRVRRIIIRALEELRKDD